jgi:hypothetical protein
MPLSPDTLLRLVHRVVVPPPAPRVLGVDDGAWRRGQSYGTILVDLERNTVIDLLPDRETATLATWLKRHEGIEVVARDRAGAYADAVRQGAPEAVQAADRWHLLRNLGEALQGVVDRHRGAVRRAARAVADETPAPVGPVPPPATREEQRRTARHDRRLRYEEMVRLHRLGLPGHAIGRAVGASPLTVYRWLKAGGPPTPSRSGPAMSPHTRPSSPAAGPRAAATAHGSGASSGLRAICSCLQSSGLMREIEARSCSQ